MDGEAKSAAIGSGENVTFNVEIGETYTLTEYAADGNALPAGVWTATGLGEFTAQSAALTIDVTNTRNATSLAFTKVWEDNANAEKTRPATIEVVAQVLVGDDWTTVANAEPETLTVQPTGTSQRYTDLFANHLPVKALDGTDYKYRVAESTQTIAGQNGATYTSSVDGATVTNTLKAGSTSFTATKVWVDGGNAQQTRPTTEGYAAWLTLYRKSATGTTWAEVNATPAVTDNGDSTWTLSYEELELYDATGAKYTYAVAEAAQGEYVLSIAGNTAEVQGATAALNGATLTNTLSATTNIIVQKVWNDGDGLLDAALIPDVDVQVVVDRMTDPEPLTVTLNKGNNWTATLSGLPKYDAAGKLYAYTAAETGVVNGMVTIKGINYAVGVVQAPAYTFTVTNTRQND